MFYRLSANLEREGAISQLLEESFRMVIKEVPFHEEVDTFLPLLGALEEVAFHNKDLDSNPKEEVVDSIKLLKVEASYIEEVVESSTIAITHNSPFEVVANNSSTDNLQEEVAYSLHYLHYSHGDGDDHLHRIILLRQVHCLDLLQFLRSFSKLHNSTSLLLSVGIFHSFQRSL